MTDKNQAGRASLVIIIIVLLVVLGCLGYLFWQGVSHHTSPTPHASRTPSSGAPKAQTVTYVTLDQWGVKFTAPTDGTVITTAYVNDSYGLSTTLLEGLSGPDCRASSGGAGFIVRLAKPRSGSVGVTEIPLHNNQPLNGYYYYFDEPNGNGCGSDPQTQPAETAKVEKAVQTLTAA